MTALFDGLFDDAALFPPGNASLTEAVPAHRVLRARLGRLVGPFVVPAARLGPLQGHLTDGPLEVSVIAAVGELAAALRRVRADARLTLAAVEVSAVRSGAAATESIGVLDDVLPVGVPAAVEVPRTGASTAVLDVLGTSGHRAKLRTGGVRAELFPPPAELADLLVACAQRGVAVKCTAGLHHAVRHVDPATGFHHHGFLNILVAAAAAVDGVRADAIARLLAETDPSAVAGRVRSWDERQAVRARALFTSFGTCSITEPVDDLAALGLLAPSKQKIA